MDVLQESKLVVELLGTAESVLHSSMSHPLVVPNRSPRGCPGISGTKPAALEAPR